MHCSQVRLLLTGGSVAAENGVKPQYGGSLEIGTVYVTLSALSWDPADFNWKLNHDTGLFYEQLFAGDLSKSKKAGGPFNFIPDAWLATDAIRGELVEKWEWKQDPLRVEMKVRKGVMFPEKPGVMKKRELTAEDIVFTYNRLNTSPKKLLAYFDHVDRVEAADSHTVVFYMKHYFAEWDYRFGWGYYSAIHPKEVADAGANNWKNVNGTGPYTLSEFISGNSNVYVKNPDYWDKEKIGNTEYKLPFVDKITYRTIKDEATYITALRTGKLDMLETIRWQNVDSLKKSAPQLQWNRWLEPVRHLHGDAHRRRRAVQGRPRAPRAQLRGQQGRDRQGLLQRQRRAVRLSPASRLRRLLRAARQAAGLGAGAVQVRPCEGQEAPGRSRVPQGLHHQGAGLLVQSRPHGPAAAGGGLPRAGRREARDPAAGVRRLPVGDDLADAYGRPTS